LELFCNVQQYDQTGVSWPTGWWLRHSDRLRLRLMDQSRKYYWVMPYSRLANTVTVRLAIKKLILWSYDVENGRRE